MEFSTAYWVLFFFTGLSAGFVDSIAGGGGLIAVPVLLAAGVPPHLALGTNKLQSSFGSSTAAFNYGRLGLINFSEIYLPVIFTAIGASIGTTVIKMLSAEVLIKVVPILLATVFLYSIISPKIGEEECNAKIEKNLFFVIAGLALGFYDGFIGPGTGSFWTISMVVFLGFQLKKATALTKVVNFTSNIVALGLFIAGGYVLFGVGLIMGAGQIIGALIGSKLVVVRNVGFVRNFFVTVVGLTLAKIIWDTYF
jgi:uncharacterized protein